MPPEAEDSALATEDLSGSGGAMVVLMEWRSALGGYSGWRARDAQMYHGTLR